MDGLSFKKGDKLVIIGGGFAGLQLAKSLHNKDLKILLIDKQNHHQFQPLYLHKKYDMNLKKMFEAGELKQLPEQNSQKF